MSANTVAGMRLIETTDADFQILIEGAAPRGLQLPREGVERIEVLAMLRDLANAIRPVFSPASWMMVEAGEIVGLCSIVKFPDGERIDIGYGVSPGRRRLGFASAAVGALVDWGRRDARVPYIRAETSIHNVPSQRVLERNGFERVGQRVDEEDGELVCWIVTTAVAIPSGALGVIHSMTHNGDG
jgi:RimJ/RimL family protein N-acetyltransferase